MATKAERAAAREKYCNERLTPILQAMVAEMLKVLPEDPDEYMRTWLDAKIVEEGGSPPSSAPIVLCAVSAAPPPVSAVESRPSVGTPLEITGEIVPEEEATRLSTLTQLIADTPGAARATMFTVRGSVAPVNDKQEIAKLSTLSQVIADTPGAGRNTVVTVRGTIVPESDVPRLSTLSQVIADTPGAAPRGTVVTVRATVTQEEAKRLSTLSQVIADTPGAARGTVHSQAPMVALRGSVVKDVVPVPVVEGAAPPPALGESVTVLGSVVPEAQIVAEQNRLSTLTQLINDTPGATRGTLLTVRGSVAPTNLTPQEEARMSTLSAVIGDTPGAARGTVVTVRGTIKSKPGEVITAQVVVPEEEAKRLSTLSQLIADTPGAARATTVTVRGTVVTPAEASKLSTMSALLADTPGAARATLQSVLSGAGGAAKGEPLAPLDKEEEARKQSQKRVSNAAASEQLRIISEMEHAEHDAKKERESNRKSASEAMTAQQEVLVAEHGEGVRKVPSVPDSAELKAKLSQAGISGE
jgi:hypothetical protein